MDKKQGKKQNDALHDLRDLPHADAERRVVLLARLADLYGFDEDETMVVASLAGSQEGVLNGLALAITANECLHRMQPEFVDFRDSRESFGGAIERLVKRGFLSSTGDGTLRGNHYRFTEAALTAFRNGRPFGLPQGETRCLSLLREYQPTEFLKPDILSRFKRCFPLPGNESFVAASGAFGLDAFSDREQRFFWLLACHFYHQGTVPLPVKALRAEYDCAEDILALASPLIRKGLVVRQVSVKEDSTPDDAGFLLSIKAAGVLFHGCDLGNLYSGIARFATVIPSAEIELKSLYFDAQTAQKIDEVLAALTDEGFLRAREILVRQKRNPALQVLFWGPPGTGKTEVARQIARACGRDLILLNISNMLYTSWGQSEKAYQTLFAEYRYVVATAKRAPILMLNEADSILSRRITNLERAIDKAENTLTTIVLQAFEDMSGILFATTNYAELLDDAFSRRFLVKIHLDRPSADIRKSLWREALPDLAEDDICRLASDYDLTGSQIANVAARWALAELFNVRQDLNYLLGLCREELSISKEAPVRRIGF